MTQSVAAEMEQLALEAEQRIDVLLKHSLPLSRIKKICRLDPEVHMLNADAARMMTKATELFIGELAKACYTQAIIDKRKTIQHKDIDNVIQHNWIFNFLEDALDGWPEFTGKSRTTVDGNAGDVDIELNDETTAAEVDDSTVVQEMETTDTAEEDS